MGGKSGAIRLWDGGLAELLYRDVPRAQSVSAFEQLGVTFAPIGLELYRRLNDNAMTDDVLPTVFGAGDKYDVNHQAVVDWMDEHKYGSCPFWVVRVAMLTYRPNGVKLVIMTEPIACADGIERYLALVFNKNRVVVTGQRVQTEYPPRTKFLAVRSKSPQT